MTISRPYFFSIRPGISNEVPGGMLSNLIAQLKQQNALDKLGEVLQETPRVRKDLADKDIECRGQIHAQFSK